MKSTGSVVTYLIFEFFIPAVFIMQTVYEIALLFSLEYYVRASRLYLGGPNTTVRPRGGPSVRPSGEGRGL